MPVTLSLDSVVLHAATFIGMPPLQGYMDLSCSLFALSRLLLALIPYLCQCFQKRRRYHLRQQLGLHWVDKIYLD